MPGVFFKASCDRWASKLQSAEGRHPRRSGNSIEIPSFKVKVRLLNIIRKGFHQQIIGEEGDKLQWST